MALSDEELIRELGRRSTAELQRIVTELQAREAAVTQRLASPENVQLLRDRAQSLCESESFEVGDVVYWKPGMKNRTRPAYGMPAVVLQILDTPVIDAEKNSASQYFREPLDIQLGILEDDADHELIFYFFDRRRFTKSPLGQHSTNVAPA